MNVYIGITDSNSVITDSLALRLVKPPDEKLGPSSMKNPPNIQTPASSDGATCFCGVALSLRFTSKKVINSINGDNTVAISTSRPLNLLPRQTWRSVSGNQKPTAPSNISLISRAHCIGTILSRFLEACEYCWVRSFPGVRVAQFRITPCQPVANCYDS